MRQTLRYFVPVLESFEGRIAPALVTAYNAATQTLMITETSTGDDTITLETIVPKQVTVTASANTILNGVNDGVITFGPAAKPVKNIVARLGKGNDTVTLGSDTNPSFIVPGNLSLNFTTGNKTVENSSVTAGTISITGNLGIASTVGNQKANLLRDITVGKSTTINNGAGSTVTDFFNTAIDGVNTFGGNVMIKNGAGFDQNLLFNANVKGSVTFNNGPGSASGGGTESLINNAGVTGGVAIQGGVTIANTSGVSVVLLNADAFNASPAQASVGFFDAGPASSPYTIRGSVRVNVSGGGLLLGGVGFANSHLSFGNSGIAAANLNVNGAMFVCMNGSISDLIMNNLVVGGQFNYWTGRGDSTNEVAIGFAGAGVQFKGNVSVKFGSGGFNELNLASGAGGVSFLGKASFLGGSGVGNHAAVDLFNITSPLAPAVKQFVEFP